MHAALLRALPGLAGGADLLPHLRLIQLMAEEPALRSVYAPAYHAIGALVTAPGSIRLQRERPSVDAVVYAQGGSKACIHRGP